MHILEQLGLALGLASLAGVNLYLTVLLAGLAVRFDLLHLAQQYQSLEVLGHPVVLIVAGILFCIEFLADKIPWVDSLWDSVHTVIRPVGGVMLGLQALGEVPVYMQVVAGLLAGGAALTTHGAKAGTRLLINHSPEPASNIGMSLSEDVAVTGGVALTLLHPAIALGVFAAILLLIWMLLPRLWRGGRATAWLAWNKLKMPGLRRPMPKPVTLKRLIRDDLRDLLQLQAGIDDKVVEATVPCLSGKTKGIRGLSPNLEGMLILTGGATDNLLFAASKGLSDRVFILPLRGVTIQVESCFLSENLVLEGPGLRAVFRFPRGCGDLVETVALHLSAPTSPDPVSETEAPHSAPQVSSDAVTERYRAPLPSTLPRRDEVSLASRFLPPPATPPVTPRLDEMSVKSKSAIVEPLPPLPEVAPPPEEVFAQAPHDDVPTERALPVLKPVIGGVATVGPEKVAREEEYSAPPANEHNPNSDPQSASSGLPVRSAV